MPARLREMIESACGPPARRNGFIVKAAAHAQLDVPRLVLRIFFRLLAR